MDKKVLDKIEPYNDLFHTCFSNSFIPVVRYFMCNEIPYLLNDIFYYRYVNSNNKMKLYLYYDSVKTFEQLNCEQGIIAKTIAKSENIIEDIIDSLTRNMPAIVWIDTYYEPIIEDAYSKIHLEHSLLFYGFDKSKELFNVIEQKSLENVVYEKRIINFSDVANAYKECLENYPENSSTFSSFGIDGTKRSKENNNSIDYISLYISNVMCLKDKIFNGLDNLKAFAEDFYRIAQNDKLIHSKKEELLNMINPIILNKQLENHRTSLLFGGTSKYYMLQEDILSDWKYIRATIAKIIYSSSINYKMLQSSIGRMKNICELEQEYFQTLLC